MQPPLQPVRYDHDDDDDDTATQARRLTSLKEELRQEAQTHQQVKSSYSLRCTSPHFAVQTTIKMEQRLTDLQSTVDRQNDELEQQHALTRRLEQKVESQFQARARASPPAA